MARVIGEIGINHDGSFKIAKRLIQIIAKSGAWGVKFQYRNINNYFKNKNFKQKEIGEEIIDKEIKRNYLSPKKIILLAEYCKKNNLNVGISYFSVEDSYDFDDYNFDFYKIPSSVSNDINLIKKLKSKKKILMISFGAYSNQMINKFYLLNKKIIDDKKVVAMHCVSNYPLHAINAQLHNIDYLKKKFKFAKIGYSSHDSDIGSCIYSLSKNIDYLERHVTISKNNKGLDHSSSSDENEFISICLWANNINRIDNKKGGRVINSGEKNNYVNLSKSYYALRDIKKNEVLKYDMLYSSFPYTGIRLDEIKNYINKPVLNFIPKGYPINFSDLEKNKFKISKYKNYFNKKLISLPVRPMDYEKINEDFKLNNYELHLSYSDIIENKIKNFKSDFLASKYISIHVPDYCNQHNVMDLFSKNKTIKKNSKIIFKKCLEFAKFINSINKKKIYIICSFAALKNINKKIFYKKIANFIKKNSNEKYEILPQWLPPFAWYFGGSVRIYGFCDPRDIIFINKFKMNICLDISHFILSCNYFHLNKDLFFDKINSRSKHFHLSDGSAVDGEGEMLGSGELSKTKILKKIFKQKYKVKVLETWQGHLNNFHLFKFDLNYLYKKLINNFS